MKRNLISQKRKKEEETRVFMCAASRDCEADLTILDTVLVFSLSLSLSPLAVVSVSSSFVASLQSLLQSQALWAARGCWPLLLYFLTSFMGCHVSNGNGNLCVCNWTHAASRAAEQRGQQIFNSSTHSAAILLQIEPDPLNMLAVSRSRNIYIN